MKQKMWHLSFLMILCILGISNVLGKKREYDRNMLFRFTSKSCGICERFSKDWDKLVRETKSDAIKNVDCDTDLKFCLEQNIRSFPTFKVYSKYEGFVDFYYSTDFKPLKEFVNQLETYDCYASETCSPEFYKWLDSDPDMTLETAVKELKDVNKKFSLVFQNITGKVQKYKQLALEKVEYINKYKNDL